MPIYEYQCGACNHKLEAIQRVNDPVLKKCPACGKLRLRKLLSPAGFQLKGTGWYVTDFKDKGKKKDKAGDAGADAKTKKEEKKSDPSSTAGSDD
jgi:putative FmdB family regulatory protein